MISKRDPLQRNGGKQASEEGRSTLSLQSCGLLCDCIGGLQRCCSELPLLKEFEDQFSLLLLSKLLLTMESGRQIMQLRLLLQASLLLDTEQLLLLLAQLLLLLPEFLLGMEPFAELSQRLLCLFSEALLLEDLKLQLLDGVEQRRDVLIGRGARNRAVREMPRNGGVSG